MNKQINKNNNNNSNNNGNKKQLVAGNTNFKIEVVSAIKRTEILKYTCFHVIPYIHFPRDEALSGHVNRDHRHVSRYKSYCQKDKLG